MEFNVFTLTSTKQTPTGADVTGAGVMGAGVTGAGVFCICGTGVTGAEVTGGGVAGAKVDGVKTYMSVPEQGDPDGGTASTETSVVKDEPLHK